MLHTVKRSIYTFVLFCFSDDALKWFSQLTTTRPNSGSAFEHVTLVVLDMSLYAFANSVDPDQRAPGGAL
jgi:hypothetical protein